MAWLPIPVLDTEEGSQAPELERHENVPAPNRSPDRPRWYSSADTGSTQSILSSNTHLTNTETPLLENEWVAEVWKFYLFTFCHGNRKMYFFFFLIWNVKYITAISMNLAESSIVTGS